VLSDVRRNDFTTLRISVGEDILHEVIAKLIASNVNERHARAVDAGFRDAIQVTIKEIDTSGSQTLFNHLGSVLVGAILASKA
jgi:hypothetical protein